MSKKSTDTNWEIIFDKQRSWIPITNTFFKFIPRNTDLYLLIEDCILADSPFICKGYLTFEANRNPEYSWYLDDEEITGEKSPILLGQDKDVIMFRVI